MSFDLLLWRRRVGTRRSRGFVYSVLGSGVPCDGVEPLDCDAIGPTPCYSPEIFDTPGIADFESVPGGALTLSPFNAAGIATGQMNTTEGIVPLVVKSCF